MQLQLESWAGEGTGGGVSLSLLLALSHSLACPLSHTHHSVQVVQVLTNHLHLTSYSPRFKEKMLEAVIKGEDWGWIEDNKMDNNDRGTESEKERTAELDNS